MKTTTKATMKMHNPPHPGEILKQLCLEPLKLSVTEATRGLGVSRKTLSSILNGRSGISPEMAVRLSIAFDTSAESWLNQQVQYDLWNAERARKRLQVSKLTTELGTWARRSDMADPTAYVRGIRKNRLAR